MQRASLIGLFALVLCAPVRATETERLYLSGTGPHDAVEWEFSIDRGRRAGDWTTIPVPSQWELQGFGEFAYGMDDEVRAEVGSYRTRFAVPGSLQGRRIDLVFEGAMTDVRATLNGKLAGPPHQGGFTRFSYDVTDLVQYGEAGNLLEVEVSEASDDRSVNAAERDADYWVFGGIYRPVYLEARPANGIRHVAIDARHDGRIQVDIEIDDLARKVEVKGRVVDGRGTVVGALTSGPGDVETGLALVGTFPGVEPWSAERPRLHTLEVELREGATVLHRLSRVFGFRTIEVREGDGLFINGRRTLLKGINRHSFWPSSGRSLTPRQNRRDVQLIKELNANAVRASHYPPDKAFLEACDELGLYVINELPGWHDDYATAVGRRLVDEMVRRDVNHPSVIIWANGNEGGWNSSLDGEFGRNDPQARPVLHPQDVFGGFDTFHYPSWEELRAIVAGEGFENWLRSWFRPLPLVMPTEMLHGLYDGGLGAGLAEYWKLIRESPRGAGGFLWAFLDESVLRIDRGGMLDSFSNYAPDGIVGPYREKEASFATVREIWSPVVLIGSDIDRERISLRFENRFIETDLSECRFDWRWLRWPGPGSGGEKEVIDSGGGDRPGAGPGDVGELVLPLLVGADALEVTVADPSGQIVETWVISVTDRSSLLQDWLSESMGDGGSPVSEARATEVLQLTASGSAQSVSRRWHEYPSGWVKLEVDLEKQPMIFLDAVDESRSVEWLGRGPDPVWGNRREGPDLGLWTGSIPGFYDGVIWARIQDDHGSLLMIVDEPGIYTGFSAPRFSEDARGARANVPPPGSLSLHSSIPGIGSKFHQAEEMGPPGKASSAPSALSVGADRPGGVDRHLSVVWFYRDGGR
jgi:hypothetical protein